MVGLHASIIPRGQYQTKGSHFRCIQTLIGHTFYFRTLALPQPASNGVVSNPSTVTIPHIAPMNINREVQEAIEERERIQQRKLNLIISNLNESEDPNEDVTRIRAMIQDKLHVTSEVSITDFRRLGERSADPTKHRMVRISLANLEENRKILRSATELRQLEENDEFYNVFIRPDLTPKQVVASKNLYLSLKEVRKKNPTKKFKIYRGEIKEIVEVNVGGQ